MSSAHPRKWGKTLEEAEARILDLQAQIDAKEVSFRRLAASPYRGQELRAAVAAAAQHLPPDLVHRGAPAHQQHTLHTFSQTRPLHGPGPQSPSCSTAGTPTKPTITAQLHVKQPPIKAAVCVQQLAQALEKRQAKADALKEANEQLARQLRECKAKLAAAEAAVVARDLVLAARQEEVAQLKDEVSGASNQVQAAEARAAQLEGELASLKAEISIQASSGFAAELEAARQALHGSSPAPVSAGPLHTRHHGSSTHAPAPSARAAQSPGLGAHPHLSPKSLADLRCHLRALGVEVDELHAENRRLRAARGRCSAALGARGVAATEGARARAREAGAGHELSNALMRMLSDPAGRSRLHAALVAADAAADAEDAGHCGVGMVGGKSGVAEGVARGRPLGSPAAKETACGGNSTGAFTARSLAAEGRTERWVGVRSSPKGAMVGEGPVGPASVASAAMPASASSTSSATKRRTRAGPDRASARGAVSKAEVGVEGGGIDGSRSKRKGSNSGGSGSSSKGLQEVQGHVDGGAGGRPEWVAQAEAAAAAAAAGALLEQLRADNAALNRQLQAAVAQLEAAGREQRCAALASSRAVQVSEPLGDVAQGATPDPCVQAGPALEGPSPAPSGLRATPATLLPASPFPPPSPLDSMPRAAPDATVPPPAQARVHQDSARDAGFLPEGCSRATRAGTHDQVPEQEQQPPLAGGTEARRLQQQPQPGSSPPQAESIPTQPHSKAMPLQQQAREDGGAEEAREEAKEGEAEDGDEGDVWGDDEEGLFLGAHIMVPPLLQHMMLFPLAVMGAGVQEPWLPGPGAGLQGVIIEEEASDVSGCGDLGGTSGGGSAVPSRGPAAHSHGSREEEQSGEQGGRASASSSRECERAGCTEPVADGQSSRPPAAQGLEEGSGNDARRVQRALLAEAEAMEQRSEEVAQLARRPKQWLGPHTQAGPETPGGMSGAPTCCMAAGSPREQQQKAGPAGASGLAGNVCTAAAPRAMQSAPGQEAQERGSSPPALTDAQQEAQVQARQQEAQEAQLRRLLQQQQHLQDLLQAQVQAQEQQQQQQQQQQQPPLSQRLAQHLARHSLLFGAHPSAHPAWVHSPTHVSPSTGSPSALGTQGASPSHWGSATRAPSAVTGSSKGGAAAEEAACGGEEGDSQGGGGPGSRRISSGARKAGEAGRGCSDLPVPAPSHCSMQQQQQQQQSLAAAAQSPGPSGVSKEGAASSSSNSSSSSSSGPWQQNSRGASACSLHSVQNVRRDDPFAGLYNDELGCVDAKESSGSSSGGGSRSSSRSRTGAVSLHSVQDVVGGGPVVYNGVAVSPGFAFGARWGLGRGESQAAHASPAPPLTGAQATQGAASDDGDRGSCSSSTSVHTGLRYGSSKGGSAANSVRSTAGGPRSLLDFPGVGQREEGAGSGHAWNVGLEGDAGQQGLRSGIGAGSIHAGKGLGPGKRRKEPCLGPSRMPGWERQADGVVRFVGWGPASQAAPDFAGLMALQAAKGGSLARSETDYLGSKLHSMDEVLREFSSFRSC